MLYNLYKYRKPSNHIRQDPKSANKHAEFSQRKLQTHHSTCLLLGFTLNTPDAQLLLSFWSAHCVLLQGLNLPFLIWLSISSLSSSDTLITLVTLTVLSLYWSLYFCLFVEGINEWIDTINSRLHLLSLENTNHCIYY